MAFPSSPRLQRRPVASSRTGEDLDPRRRCSCRVASGRYLYSCADAGRWRSLRALDRIVVAGGTTLRALEADDGDLPAPVVSTQRPPRRTPTSRTSADPGPCEETHARRPSRSTRAGRAVHALKQARPHITVDPGVLGGTPCSPARRAVTPCGLRRASHRDLPLVRPRPRRATGLRRRVAARLCRPGRATRHRPATSSPARNGTLLRCAGQLTRRRAARARRATIALARRAPPPARSTRAVGTGGVTLAPAVRDGFGSSRSGR